MNKRKNNIPNTFPNTTLNIRQSKNYNAFRKVEKMKYDQLVELVKDVHNISKELIKQDESNNSNIEMYEITAHYEAMKIYLENIKLNLGIRRTKSGEIQL